MSKLGSIALLTLLLAACRGGSQSGDDDDDDGQQPDDAQTVYEVQSDDMAVGTPVALKGVVVTAIDTFGGRTGSLYVQEPDGGEFSGIGVFASPELTAELRAGDVVDIENAVKDEFALQADTTGKTLTQLRAPEGSTLRITRVGEDVVPEPVALDPWTLAASDEEAEKWEGVLIRFTGARVFFTPEGVSNTDPTLKEMTVTGPFRVSSTLTDLADTIERDGCFASITGIGDYFFNYKLLPRSADDLVPGADADCLPIEASLELCGDTTDNDHNGFSDCGDFACQDAVASCTSDVTIAQIQAGEIADGARVRIADAVITARSYNKERLWVQAAGAGGEHAGIYVHSRRPVEGAPENTANEFDESFAAGTKITFTATVTDFGCGGGCEDNKLTQLTGAEIERAPESAVATTPVVGLSLADAIGEGYEGVLVTLANVKVGVTSDKLGGTSGTALVSREFEISDGTTTLHVDDEVFRINPALAEGLCKTVTGIMHFNTSDDADEGGLPPHTTVIPRSRDDIADSNGCN